MNLWENITFKTQCYRKNFDLTNDNENIITECEGKISEIKISEHKPPFIVGEYGFSVWNIKLGKKFGVSMDFNRLIKEYADENTYDELLVLIKNKRIDITKFDKLVLVHNLVIHPVYRKHEICEEFVEMLYRDFYDDNVCILMLVKPFQDNPIDRDFYLNRRFVELKEKLGMGEAPKLIRASEYYSLNDFLEKKDVEMNEYKLFNVASKCGFIRIDESYLFRFTPDKTINRILERHKKLRFNVRVIE